MSLADGRPGAEFSRQRSGAREVRDFFSEILNDWRMNYFAMTEFIEGGNRIVVIGCCSWTHKKTDRRVNTPKIGVWTFEKGRTTKFSEFYDTVKVFAAATE